MVGRCDPRPVHFLGSKWLPDHGLHLGWIGDTGRMDRQCELRYPEPDLRHRKAPLLR